VEAGGRQHPQAAITATTWTAQVTIGGAGFGANHNEEFSIHLIATSKSANDAFTSYLSQQSKLPPPKGWHGLPLPDGIRILATRTVRRNDQASALANLIGTYDEYRDKPLTPTQGTISIAGSPHGPLAVTATNQKRQIEWKGTIKVAVTGQTAGDYQNTSKNGRGTLELQQSAGGISVTGQDSAPGTKPFYMIWKRRTP
jgi:hypothetical protein